MIKNTQLFCIYRDWDPTNGTIIFEIPWYTFSIWFYELHEDVNYMYYIFITWIV